MTFYFYSHKNLTRSVVRFPMFLLKHFFTRHNQRTGVLCIHCYITAIDYSQLINFTEIPTDKSQLEEGAGQVVAPPPQMPPNMGNIPSQGMPGQQQQQQQQQSLMGKYICYDSFLVGLKCQSQKVITA